MTSYSKAFTDIASWASRQQGQVLTAQLAEDATGHDRRRCSSVLLAIHNADPVTYKKLQRGMYLVSVNGAAPPAPPAPPPPPAEESQPELPPDPANGIEDDPGPDLYAPLTISPYDDFVDRKGQQWYRVRDEQRRRGLFRYLDEG